MRYKVPPDLNEKGYMANLIPGAVPSLGVAAVRYNSMIVQEHIVNDMKRWDATHTANLSWGFVLLVSLETGEPLAYIHDLAISAMRVGATTGVAHRALSKKGATTIGLFGSGYQAIRNLEAICCVRRVSQVKVFSPNKEHRESFAKDMTKMLNVDVRPVETARDAVRGMDIVMCATNSSQPVFEGNWLEPGQIATTINNTDGVHNRTEADSETMIRADLIVVNSKKTVFANQQRELLDLIDQGKVSWDKVCELGEVLIGKHPGRTSDRQFIYYKSNTGVGIQFAAAGATIYNACKKAKLGRDLPTEWFGGDVSRWIARGYKPAT
jgi:ornithine cyclodeaminase